MRQLPNIELSELKLDFEELNVKKITGIYDELCPKLAIRPEFFL